MYRVVRKYWSKKQGKQIVKVYEYKHKSTRKPTLVGKNGKVNTKNVNKYKQEIMSDPNLTPSQKRTIVNDLDAVIKDRKATGKKLTVAGFEGHRARNEVDRMFANAGRDIDDVAAEHNIDPNALRNTKNWNGNQFTWNGETWTFKFSYTGDLLS